MKKVLLILLLVVGLVGCENSNTVQATKKSDDEKILVDIQHSDQEIVSYRVDLTKKIDTKVVKKIGKQKMDELLAGVFKSMNYSGVKVSSDFDEDKNSANVTLEVYVKNLNKADYAKFGINNNRDLKYFIKVLKKDGFKITNDGEY